MVNKIDDAARMVLDPLNQAYEQTRKITVVSVIFLTCVTGGLILAVSVLWRQLRRAQADALGPNQTHEKIWKLFARITGQLAHNRAPAAPAMPAGPLHPGVPAPASKSAPPAPAPASPPEGKRKMDIEAKIRAEADEKVKKQQFPADHLQAFRFALEQVYIKARETETDLNSKIQQLEKEAKQYFQLNQMQKVTEIQQEISKLEEQGKAIEKKVVIEMGNTKYAVWFTDKTSQNHSIIWNGEKCGVINIQPIAEWKKCKQDKKIGLLITPGGEIISAHRNGQPAKDIQIHEDEMPLIQACFKEALIRSSQYECIFKDTLAPDIQITTIRKSLETIPEYHLRSFTDSLLHRIKGKYPKFCPKVTITFLEPNLKIVKSHDSGGLIKDYVGDLVNNFIKSKKEILFEHYRFYLVPKLDSEDKKQIEEKMLVSFGALLMFCFKSSQKRKDYPNGIPLPTGIYFSPTMFEAIVQLNAQEIDQPFSSLSIEKQSEMIATLLKIKEEEGVEKATLKSLSKISKFCLKKAVTAEDDEALIEAMQHFAYGCDGSISDKFLTDDGMTINPEKVKENRAEAFQELRKKDGLGAQLKGLHAVARGMKNLCNPENIKMSNEVWNEHFYKSERTQVIAMNEAIQGTMNREEIAASIVVSNLTRDPKTHEMVPLTPAVLNVLQTKTGWLQEWLRKEASEEEIRDFLKYVTASTCFPSGGTTQITIGIAASSLPEAHTCSNQIDLPPQFSSKGLFQDDTKEKFIALLKTAMIEGKDYGLK